MNARSPTGLLQTAVSTLFMILSGCAAHNNTDATISDSTRNQLARALAVSGDQGNAALVLRSANGGDAAPAARPLADAEVLVASGHVDDGIAAARTALAARGDDPPFALDVARLAIRSGRLTQAGEVYQQILDRHPDNVEGLNGKGVVLAQQGDLAGAASAFRQALSRQPEDVPARNNLTLVKALSGQTDPALSMSEDLNHSSAAPLSGSSPQSRPY